MNTHIPTPPLTHHQRLQEAHRRIILLMGSHRFSELTVLLESLQHQLKDYYKIVPSTTKDVQAIRTLNKLRKREEIALLHNEAIVRAAQNQFEHVIDLRTIIVQELNSMVQAEQTRYGFLEGEEEGMRRTTLQSIAYWKRELVRHYYFLATATYHQQALEVSLAALMKGLDLIREWYQQDLQIAKGPLDRGKSTHDLSYSQQLCRFEQVEELHLLCQLRERVGHSKYLNIVSINTLIDMVSNLARDVQDKSESPVEFELFQLEKMHQLELPLLETVISDEYQGWPMANQFQINKIAHFLYLGLLGRIYSQQNKQIESQYQRLKNTKNVILVHGLHAAIAHHYLPNCSHTDKALQSYRNLYKPKSAHHQRQPPSVYTLIQIFGLTPEGLSQQNHTNEEVSIIQASHLHKPKKTVKKVKSSIKVQANSVPKSKSKSKNKPPKKAPQKIQKKTQQQRRQRVREEYMLKREGKHTARGEDYLLKAISQNYRSFDSSRSKEKHTSPFKRAIRTETCINDQKHKEGQPAKPLITHPHRKKHH